MQKVAALSIFKWTHLAKEPIVVDEAFLSKQNGEVKQNESV